MVLSYQRLKLAFLESTPIPFLPLLGCQRRGSLVDLRNSFRPRLYTRMDWATSVSIVSFGRTVFLLNLGAGPGCFCPTALKSQAIRRRKSFSRPRLKSLSSPMKLARCFIRRFRYVPVIPELLYVFRVSSRKFWIF